ncbi:MAG TPA: hypothetical protein VFJ94_08105 [Intrasporangium sp.]|uniref:hypothetical protein n=1 Tax=Intrasporangium sp. TaxID=1925024 RepID=UPI002D77248D|nr:hypothetical protein [Intrasporangium sp.]HET7398472.1 hypothetical protein [Intrasporangium sp.]
MHPWIALELAHARDHDLNRRLARPRAPRRDDCGERHGLRTRSELPPRAARTPIGCSA